MVETADAVLVAHKDKVQDVKAIVEQLRQQGRSEVLLHRRVNRPWGAYEGVDRGERFQVKRITVNPGAKLSSQMHHHRAEHWVVVKGVITSYSIHYTKLYDILAAVSMDQGERECIPEQNGA